MLPGQMIDWFLCGYKERRKLAYYCEMDDFTPEILRSDGDWSEAQISGKKLQALVRVRAKETTLKSLRKKFKSISDTEASSLQLSGKTLADLANEVPANALSKEYQKILSLWLGLGFGLGWRLPFGICVLLAQTGAPSVYVNEALRFYFDQNGAFPTTPVLDTFVRANENPLSQSGAWSYPMNASGTVNLQVLNNLCQPVSNSYGESYRVASFGPDSEAYITTPTANASVELWVRVASPGTAGLDAYFLHGDITGGTYQLWKCNDTVQTQLGASVSQTISNGNSEGVEVIGSTVKGYINTGSGYTQVISRSDSSITLAGNLGLILQETTISGSNFGGGTVIVSLGKTRRLLSLLGVG